MKPKMAIPGPNVVLLVSIFAIFAAGNTGKFLCFLTQNTTSGILNILQQNLVTFYIFLYFFVRF